MHTSPSTHKLSSPGQYHYTQQIASQIPWGVSAALGTIIGSGAALGPTWFRACTAIALLVSLYFYAAYKQSQTFTQNLLRVLLFAGISGARSYQIQQNFLHATTHIPRAKSTISAHVISGDLKPSQRFSYAVKVNNVTIFNNGISTQLPGGLELYVRTPLWLSPGDQISVKDIQLKPYCNTKMQLWALRHNLIASAFLEPSQIKKKGAHKATLARTIHKAKIRLLKKIKSLLTPAAYRLFKTVILGITWNSYATDRLRCTFMSWGLAHMLARSGLHMALIIAILSMLALPLGTSSTAFFFLTISAILSLSLFSWNGLSFMRSVLMWIMAQTAHCLRRRPHVLHILSLTVICYTLWQPAIVFFLDFQLTFGVTGILALFSLLQSTTPHTINPTSTQSKRRHTLTLLKPLKQKG